MVHVWLPTAKLFIISDLSDYQAVATDIATGKPPMVTSRSQHREFLKRNGYQEMGNETPTARQPQPVNTREIGQQIKQFIDQKGIRL